MTKTILGRHGAGHRHWVGDGFPVRTPLSYADPGADIDPFLLLDHAGPHLFAPAARPRGVGAHPHRGFETVTIVLDGEVEHRDSAGHGGVIGPGDVQWMTAGAGILHAERHSKGFTRTGGPFRMVQLWVNLPARHKAAPAGYQAIPAAAIPAVELPHGAGTVRVIAGDLRGTRGPARTFTPVNVWDVRLAAEADVAFELPEGHTALVAVLAGHVTVNGTEGAGEAEAVRLGREGTGVHLHADGAAALLVLGGRPIGGPVVGHGPFVMTSEAEIRRAVEDFRRGRFGTIAA